MQSAALVRSTDGSDAAQLANPAVKPGRVSLKAVEPEPRSNASPKPNAQAQPAAATADVGQASESPTDASKKRQPVRGDLFLYLLLTVMVVAAWRITRLGLFSPGDDIGYWIGVGGGSMLALLFVYPMRKYLRFMQRLGHVRWWFWFHLTLGILGPWLILIHSKFHIGSLNAGIALYSMVIVVVSGVIGRFIYVRIHRGLDGERTSLRELQSRAGFVEENSRSRLHFAPAVEAALLAFEQRELSAKPNAATQLRRVTVLPFQQWLAYRRCVALLREPLRSQARRRHWSNSDLAKRSRQCRKLVRRYLDAVVRVAEFTAYERLFALWHLAHLPFVYMLIISAIVHVIAVHAY